MKFDSAMLEDLDTRLQVAGVTLEGTEGTEALRTAFYEFNADGTLKDPAKERNFVEKSAVNTILKKIGKTEI